MSEKEEAEYLINIENNLVSREKIDIKDISIIEITKQYTVTEINALRYLMKTTQSLMCLMKHSIRQESKKQDLTFRRF